MSGLNCGEVSLTAWPLNRAGVELFVAVEDFWAEEAMRMLEREGVMAGESGAAGLAGLIAVCRDAELKARLGLTVESKVLVVNTEGRLPCPPEA